MSGWEVVLDPDEVAVDRVPLDLNNGAIQVDQKGIDWGDAAIQAYMADLEVGSAPVDYRIPNREINIPIFLGGGGNEEDYAIGRAALMSKVGLLQREGGWLMRRSAGAIGAVPASGRRAELFADIVNATLQMPDKWGETGNVEADVNLRLECLPDFYGAEIELNTLVGADLMPQGAGESLLALYGVLSIAGAPAQIEGDHPGRCRIVVTNDTSEDRRGLIWGFRARNYDDGDANSGLFYHTHELTALDAASDTPLTGASSPNVIAHPNLGTGWTPILSTQGQGGGDHMTHVGTYRVRARVYSTTGLSFVAVRLLYDVGDFTAPTINDEVAIPTANTFHLVDLGEIRINEAQLGAHRWKGVIQGRGTNGGENLYVDSIEFQPLDESAGVLSAPQLTGIGINSHIARDEFNQTAGNLNAKAAAIGGVWATSGVATDFVVETTGRTAQRTTTADAGLRYAVVGAAQESQAAQVDFKYSVGGLLTGAAAAPNGGVVCRYVDAANAGLRLFSYGDTITVAKRVGGIVTTMNSLAAGILRLPWAPDIWSSLLLVVWEDGHWAAYQALQGTPFGDPLTAGWDADFAPGGACSQGQAGFFDQNVSASASTRNYDNFQAYIPESDAVVFAGQTLQLATDGVYRDDSTGVTSGPVPKVAGDLPRIPPSGLEGRPVQLFTRLSTGEFATFDDNYAPDLVHDAQVFYRPSYLFGGG